MQTVEATRLPRASTRDYPAQNYDAQDRIMADRIMAEVHRQSVVTNHKRDLHLMREVNFGLSPNAIRTTVAKATTPAP